MILDRKAIAEMWRQSLLTLNHVGFAGPDEVRQLCERLGYWPAYVPERQRIDAAVMRPKVMKAVANGCTVRDIAEALGISATSVCYLINQRPMGK